MGYESKLYVVDVKNDNDMCLGPKGMKWGQVIATFELSVFEPVRNYFRTRTNTDCYIYADDGNTIILEDRYGNPLTESNIEPLVNLLKKEALDDSFGGQPYRRIKPCLAMLEMFMLNSSQWGNLKVLHYGY